MEKFCNHTRIGFTTERGVVDKRTGKPVPLSTLQGMADTASKELEAAAAAEEDEEETEEEEVVVMEG